MALAASGRRDLDSGIEAIDDEELDGQLRKQARKIHLLALLWALALTRLALLW